MRHYPSEEIWPTTSYQAHIILIRAYRHLRNREKVEFETLDAREEINTLQMLVSKEMEAV